MKMKKPILLVEDDIVDVLTVERALKEIQMTNDLVKVQNGKQALEYLRNPENIMPLFALLDLNMPGTSGMEFLAERFKSPHLMSVPVIVLTTSKDENEVKASFEYGAAGYLVKPVEYQDFVELMRKVRDYWFNNELPV